MTKQKGGEHMKKEYAAPLFSEILLDDADINTDNIETSVITEGGNNDDDTQTEFDFD